MKTCSTVLLLTATLLLSGCSPQRQLIGLWQVEKVSVGEQAMTPIARWTRINKDNSQVSGNGWLQHSVGNWSYTPANKQLQILNTNGFKDNFGPFRLLNIDKQTMTWARTEENEEVIITFRKTKELPQAPANKLLGVWQLITDNSALAPAHLFFRWDQLLLETSTIGNQKRALYKTHGHRQEVQIIYYETPLRQVTYTYRFDNDNQLILEQNIDDTTLYLKYKRVDYLPQ